MLNGSPSFSSSFVNFKEAVPPVGQSLTTKHTSLSKHLGLGIGEEDDYSLNKRRCDDHIKIV